MMQNTEGKKLLTTPETARLLGVAVGTLNNWRSRREGPQYLKLGGKSVRYAIEDIAEWLKKRKVKTVDMETSHERKRS